MRYRYLFGWAGGLLMLFLAYDIFLAGSLLAVDGYYQYGLFGGLLMAATVLISAAGRHRWAARWTDCKPDRKSVVSGKSVSVRVDLGGRLIIKKKNSQNTKR